MPKAKSYIEFRLIGASESGKTKHWTVSPINGLAIGAINWYSPWRKYVFSAIPHTVYDQFCLREIADFVERETAAHKVELAELAGTYK